MINKENVDVWNLDINQITNQIKLTQSFGKLV